MIFDFAKFQRSATLFVSKMEAIMKLLKNLLFACAASAILFVNAAQAQVM